MNQGSVLLGLVRRGYRAVFFQNWPLWLGGLLIGIMSVITFAWGRPWGVARGLGNWGDWFFALVGAYSNRPSSPLVTSSSVLTLGLLWGALGSSLLSKQFVLRMASPLELLKGVVGGSLMGVGAAMAGGCNVGGFYSAVSALSFSGLAMMVGLLIGAYLGLRYMSWEGEHLPPQSASAPAEKGREPGFHWLTLEPYIGVILFLGALAAAWVYAQEAYTQAGGLLLCGIGFGIIIQRTRFCFVRAFRDPFMTGAGNMARAMCVSIIISVIGFAALKWTGARGEMVYVPPAFWFGALVGGISFGFGMSLAGGCGSGSVWRAGEGQVKLMVAVVFFALSMSLFKALMNVSDGLTALAGHRVFLPHYLTYKWTLVLLVLVFAVYYLAASWNEETNLFVVKT